MRARGFTLIEMLVVLLIIGMALTVVPSLLASLPNARLNAAANAMAGSLQQLRAQAIAGGQSTALLLDPASRSYATLPAGKRTVLPEVVDRVDVAAAAAYQTGEAGTFRFYADGTATGGTITLRNGNRVAAIAVDWLTGRVRRLD
jgi:general secretion pathway protein H